MRLHAWGAGEFGTTGLGALFGVPCRYLGIGSGLFNASLLRRGQQVDVAAMYAPQVVLIAVNLGRLKPRFGTTPSWHVLTVVSLTCLYVYHSLIPGNSSAQDLTGDDFPIEV